jgi:hypothetical protein
MLVQWRTPPFRTYFVWGRYSSLDDEARAREETLKHRAPNASFFWMPAPILPEELMSVLKIGTGRTIFDVYLLYRRGVLWESRLPAPTYWQQQIGVIQGDPFNVTRMEAQIQRLLAK